MIIRLISCLFILLFGSNSDAQDIDPNTIHDEDLKKDYLQFMTRYQENQKWQETINQNISELNQTIEKVEQNRKLLQEKIALHSQNKNTVIGEIEQSLKSMPLLKREVSTKANLYRCIVRGLKTDESSIFENCKRDHQAKLSPIEQSQVNDWNEKAGKTVKDLNAELNDQNQVLKENQKWLTGAMDTKKSAEQVLKVMEEGKVRWDHEVKLDLAAHQNKTFSECNAQMPEINLEKEVPYPGAKMKGAFYQVPHDYQDGIGSCYANTAKNLLVGISGGKDVASFLDLALIYKGDSVSNQNGLDGGLSCVALEKMKSKGYCPQKFSPIEIGEKNEVMDSLLISNELSGMTNQGEVINELGKFLGDQDQLKQKNPELFKQISTQMGKTVELLKANPYTGDDFQSARPIPDQETLKNLPEELSLNRNQEEECYQKYHKQYSEFFPKYLAGIFEGKTEEELFQMFKESMNPWIDEFRLNSRLDEWKASFLKMSHVDEYRQLAMDQSAESLQKLRTKAGVSGPIVRDDLKKCSAWTGVYELSHSVSSLSDLLNSMKEYNIKSDSMLNPDGTMKNPVDLMQLAVAPACLNDKNRKKPDFDFNCSEEDMDLLKGRKIPEDQKIQAMRKRIMGNLLQGLPVGNTFQRHINTVVGMRFNSSSNQCEYLIRESQRGESIWKPEKEIYDRVERITEVWRP